MLLLSTVVVAQVKVPSASEVFHRSQKAYDSVRTFEQSVRAGGNGLVGTAQISFSRPGQLRVSVMSIFKSKYDLVFDGKAAWVFNDGRWSQVENVSRGLATITGISKGAGTLVPATLTHAKWGGLDGLSGRRYTVEKTKLLGETVFKLRTARPFSRTIWIDVCTYFVVREETEFGHPSTVVYSSPKVNQAITANRFRR